MKKDPHPLKPFRDKKRLFPLALFLFCLFSLLIFQFYRLQIVEAEKWQKVAERQHYFFVKEPFLRGTFYSNPSLKQSHFQEPLKIAYDIRKYHLYIDPKNLPENIKESLGEALIETLKVPSEERQSFKEQFYKKSRSRKLFSFLTALQKEEVEVFWKNFYKKNKLQKNALFFIADYQRNYPHGKLMGQALHTVQLCRDEKTMQAIPTGGLELFFNEYLKGKEGKRRLLRSPRNALETGQVISSPVDGKDVYLTIDVAIQAIVEEELEKGVQKCGAKSGWAVVMDPFSGEILALAQYPFFYPASCKEFFLDPEKIEDTKLHALIDANEPGSVMKPFTMAIALQANLERKKLNLPEVFDPEAKMATANGSFPGRSKPIKDVRCHPFLNMNMAIQKSSNIYMGRVVEKMVPLMGIEWYRNALQNFFGFGEKTKIELPGESAGVVPTPHKKHPNGKLEWSVATPFSLAMGYNLQVTTLQLVRAFSVFANGGYLVQPTIIRKIVEKDKEGRCFVLVDNTKEERKKSFPKVLEKEVLDKVVYAMKFVTKPRGSGNAAEIYGFTEAGKTSTVKKLVNGGYSETKHVNTFIGMAPLSKPVFVLAIVMDEPECKYIPGVGKNHHGGVSVAPLFGVMGARILDYLGIPPDDPYGYPKKDPRRDSKKADFIEEAAKLQEMYEMWNMSPTKK